MNIELYKKSIKCPVCQNEFKTTKVKASRTRVLKSDTDFMIYYKSENPLLYDVIVCQKCGYAALESKYNYFPKAKKNIMQDFITSKWNKRDYTGERTVDEALLCYKLALYCGQTLKFKKFELGGLCMRIAWIHRLKEQRDEEIRFIKLARDLYEDAYSNENIPYDKMDENTLTYLMGELNKRLGDYRESINWFSKTIGGTTKPSPRIEKLTREQWMQAKELYKESGGENAEVI
ncbi:DUF2225 domain-containing protein [Clostridiaceae bacterium M8S5]|nr:DUF2225 domain-containing protein [Clostridiaceae bacterium M8S5]